ncbi:MAG TPA: hypothetical protein VFG11_04385, partial [Acidobacteriota bacterium]|nr:hypothetical protein [Acidobacteriota bacterium]
VPIVHATGGLDDTVQEWNWDQGTGNGFKFWDYNADALVDAVGRARHAYGHPVVWQRIIENGMKADFSWNRSAFQYLALYDQAIRLKS